MLLELLLSVALVWFLIKYIHYGIKPNGTPPGTIGMPIVGVLPPRNCTFEEHLNKCRKQFGDTFWLRMGSRNVVVICERETISLALNNVCVQGRAQFFSTRLSYKGHQRGIVMTEGTPWKNIRSFASIHLREGGIGPSLMESIILREAEALSDDFEKHLGENSELPWSINGSVINVLWKLIADQRFDFDDPRLNKMQISIADLFNQLQGNFFLLFDLIPWMENLVPRFIQNRFGRKKFEDGLNDLLNDLQEIMDENKETIDEDNPRDLVDSYRIGMEIAQMSLGTDVADFHSMFCEKKLLYVVWDLFSAGTETTSSTIRWYLLLIAKHPDIQKNVQEELDRVLSKDRKVRYADKESLPYLEATINETLRLKPIAPFGLFHRVTVETTIDGYLIPRDTLILPNFLACHKCPQLWENPNEFYPKHFLNEDNTLNNKKQGMFAFSTGRRACLGENLARMDLFIVLATLMQKFSFSAPEGEPLSVEQSPEQTFFSSPKPFKITINKR